jgi:hypothetical protein
MQAAVVFIGVALGWASATHAAQSAEEFYKGKTISIIVSSQPAGRFNLEATVAARHLPKYTGANVIASYAPGGGTLIGANKIFAAKPDGLTLGVSRGSKWIFSEMAKEPGVHFRWKEFIYLAKLTQPTNMALMVDARSPWKTAEDARKAGNLFLGTGIPFFEPLVFKALDLNNVRIITTAYPTIEGRVLALQRKELHMFTSGVDTVEQHHQTIKPFVMEYGDPKFPQAIVLERLKLGSEHQKWIDYIFAFSAGDWSFVAPPGVPKDRVDFLIRAFHKVYEDPDFRKEAEKLKLGVGDRFVGGEDIVRLSQSLGRLDDRQVESLKQVILEEYVKR